jgi:predicted dinucleotide-binding enzyme
MVGQRLARRFAELGYEVAVGARSADSESLAAFADVEVRCTDFASAAAGADIVVNATNGGASLAALEQAGAANLAGKPLLDVSNELVPVEGGGFPRPAASPENSLGQRIQHAFPDALVVKSLNTMNNNVMADPSLVPGDHVAFLSGDDSGAKDTVKEVLMTFGWRPAQLIDLGGIETAAATEMMMSAWMAVMMARGLDRPPFNWAINSDG